MAGESNPVAFYWTSGSTSRATRANGRMDAGGTKTDYIFIGLRDNLGPRC